MYLSVEKEKLLGNSVAVSIMRLKEYVFKKLVLFQK